MKLPLKTRAAAEPGADAVPTAAREQAVPTGSGKYTGVLALIVRERIALLELIGVDEEFALARAAAVERDYTIDEALRERRAELRGQRESSTNAMRALMAKRREQMRAAEPFLRAATQERFRLDETILGLSKRIASFDSARRAFTERMRSAGLSAEEIAGIAVKPTHDDLASWRDQLAAAQVRLAEVAAKIKGGAAAFLPETA